MRSKPMMVLIGLVVAATLLFSGGGMAVAQDNGGTVSPQSAIPCNGTVPPSGGVLCDQMDLGGGGGTSVLSQNNLGADTAFCASLLPPAPAGCLTTEAADDFIVPTTGGVAGWLINKVEVSGYYGGSGDAVSTVNIKFFANTTNANAQNVPGAPKYQGSSAVSVVGNIFTANMSSPALLKSGQTYWLEFQVNLGGGRNWYWEERTAQVNSMSAWQTTSYDPFTTGCKSWKSRIPVSPTGCGIGSGGPPPDKPDLLFKLSGSTTTAFFEVFLPIIRK